MKFFRSLLFLCLCFVVNNVFSQEDTINTEMGEEQLWDPEVPDEPRDSLKDIPDSLPHFPGGFEAMMFFISDNLVYPALAREMGVSGKVYIQFVVEKDGSISSVEVIKGFDELCEREAMRVITIMPRWTPAIKNTVPVRCRFTIPIVFKLI